MRLCRALAALLGLAAGAAHAARVLNVAHRGFSARYPENTLSSYIGALDAGADALEADVQVSADYQALLFHDETLERTSNGTGCIRNRPYFGYLDQLAVGASGERIPLLSQVLLYVEGRSESSRTPWVILNLRDANFSVSDVELVAEILNRQVYESIASKVLVTSSRPELISALVAKRPQPAPLFLSTVVPFVVPGSPDDGSLPPSSTFRASDAQSLQLALADSVGGYVVSHANLNSVLEKDPRGNPTAVHRIMDPGKMLFVSGVETEASMSDVMRWNVTGAMSSKVDVFARLLRSKPDNLEDADTDPAGPNKPGSPPIGEEEGRPWLSYVAISVACVLGVALIGVGLHRGYRIHRSIGNRYEAIP